MDTGDQGDSAGPDNAGEVVPQPVALKLPPDPSKPAPPPTHPNPTGEAWSALARDIDHVSDVLRALAQRVSGLNAPPTGGAMNPTSSPTAETPAAPVTSDDETERCGEQAIARLAPRLMDVFQRIGLGQSNEQIAAALFKSPRTIETYRYLLRRALRLRHVTALAQHAWAVAHAA